MSSRNERCHKRQIMINDKYKHRQDNLNMTKRQSALRWYKHRPIIALRPVLRPNAGQPFWCSQYAQIARSQDSSVEDFLCPPRVQKAYSDDSAALPLPPVRFFPLHGKRERENAQRGVNK
jgi:hypothetical protein